MKRGANTMNLKGFTLIEILIVVIILAAMAALAIPFYQGTVEHSRKSEALATLDGMRQSELRYYTANSSYTATLTLLDFNPMATNNSGQVMNFSYALSASGNTFTATATRNTNSGGDGTSTVSITQAGTVTGTGVFTS